MKKSFQDYLKSGLLLLLGISILGCSGDDDPVVTPEKPGEETEVPVAVDDEYSTAENSALKIDDLLENDTVFDYARVTDFDAETEEGGTVEDNRDGTFTYTPAQNFTGEDSFEYTICDNAATPNCDSATVIITVSDATPVALDDSYETSEDKELSIVSYLNNDELVNDSDISSVNTDDSEGTVTIEEDGSLTYNPAEGFAGEDTFTYTICDQGEEPACATATITVTVVDEGSPIATEDLVVVEAAGGELILDNLLVNDQLIDDAEISSINNEGTRGTVVLNEDGTVSYKPEAGFTGEDTFTYDLCDDDVPNPTCSTATVTVRVIEPVSLNIPAALADYYADVVISTDEDLNYHVLSELTENTHTTILSYGQRHQYLYDADEDLDNPDNVILMYSGESRYWEEYWSDSNNYEPQTFNTEHVYPQSRLSSEVAVSDLHHLRVADAEVNEERLNYPYVEGSGDYGLVGDSSWYPGDEWKGDVARMVLYLNLRYNENINSVGNLDLFLKWNAEDPVSDFERQRNEVIEGAQGNRNPFIDNPYLATLIWGGEPAQNTWD